MVLIILVAIAILGIAFYHTMQGLFSSVIMALLTVLCAAIALNFCGPLAEKMYPKHAPYAMAFFLAVLFAGSLIVARIVVDILLRPNVTFHEWVDRIGGGALGLFTGMIIVGIAAITLQLLPFESSIFSYKSFDETLQRRQRLAPFRPDEFTLGLVSALSRGTLGADGNFAADYRDFALRTFCYRNRANRKIGVSCPDECAELVGAWQLPAEDPWQEEMDVLKNPLLKDEENIRENSRIVIVRVAISTSVLEHKQTWELPATNFRLVYPDGRNFYPLAYLTYPSGADASNLPELKWAIWAPPTAKDSVTGKPRLKVTELIVLRSKAERDKNDRDKAKDALRRDGWLVVDWVYRLPAVEDKSEDKADDVGENGPERETITDETDDPEQQEPIPSQTEPPMWLVFRRGVRMKIRDIQPGRPPEQNALSHGKRPARRAK